MAALIETRDKNLSVMSDIIEIVRETEKAICFKMQGVCEYHEMTFDMWFPKAAVRPIGDGCYELKSWWRPSDRFQAETKRRCSYFMV